MSGPKPTAGPWKAGELRFEPKEPWPTDHPLLPTEEPKEAWIGSIFGPDGQQIVRHEACWWRPSEADWNLMARAPDLLAENQNLRAKVELAGALIEEVVVRFSEHADVRQGVVAWHFYASELKPWLDDNRPGWRSREAALARKESPP